MILVILAAGRGSRLKFQTVHLPKPLVKINNQSLIEYNLRFINFLHLQTFERIIMNEQKISDEILELQNWHHKSFGSTMLQN